MKALLVVCVALACLALADKPSYYTFKHAKHPCNWVVDVEAKGLLIHYTTTLAVYDWYAYEGVTNHEGVLISENIVRPDIGYKRKSDNETMITFFQRSGSSCTHEVSEGITQKDWKNATVRLEIIKNMQFFAGHSLKYLMDAENFTNKDEGTIEEGGEKYTRYWNNVTRYDDRKPEDIFALYVNKDDYVVAVVTDNDLPGERIVYKFTYGIDFPLERFVFKEKYIQNCTDNGILKAPSSKDITGSKCESAASLQVALALVLLSIVSALLF